MWKLVVQYNGGFKNNKETSHIHTISCGILKPPLFTIAEVVFRREMDHR